MAVPDNATFGTFQDGGDLVDGDIVVGLRTGVNTRFNFKADLGLFLPLAGGTMAGAIDMDDNSITGVPTPLSPSDAANKAYVDTITGGEAMSRVDDTNVTLTLGGTPLTSLLHAVSLTLGWTGQLAVTRGGTGLAALTAHNLLIGNGTSAATLLAPSATSGVPLISQGAAADPAYGTAVVAGGGTGNTTFTAYSVICAGTTATGAFQNVSGVGTLNQVLVSQGAGALPQWASVPGLVPAALTRVDDTNVTLTLGGTPATSLLQSVSLTLGWTGTLSETRGGTAQSTYTLGDILYSSAANTLSKLAGNTTSVKQYLSQTGTGAVSAAPAWATISGSDITGAALTKTDDTNVTLSLGGTPTTALLRAASLTLGWTGQLALTRGGTNASLTASNGGIVYSTASAMAILAGTATANQVLLSGSSAAPAWSTATYPATTTINQILYSSANNVLTGLATVNSAGLLTNGSGVPGWVAYTGTGAPVLGTSPTITTPLIITALKDANSNKMISFDPIASANNYFEFKNSVSGGSNAIGFSAQGADTNLVMTIAGKGTGRSQIKGTGSNDNVSDGYVGEFVSSVVAFASAVSLTTATDTDVTSISLTAGDWDVWGNTSFAINGVCTSIGGWVSSTSATQPDFSLRFTNSSAGGLGSSGYTVPQLRFSLGATTTIYLSARAVFSTSTVTVCGGIYARRRS